MNIKAFADKSNKSENTIKLWISKGYLPGANMEDDYIPDSARIPCTNARARKGTALIKSILKACDNSQGIFPDIFHITPEEFHAILSYMEQEGLILPFGVDGVTYYNITLKGHDSLQKFGATDWIQVAIALAAWTPILIQLFAK